MTNDLLQAIQKGDVVGVRRLIATDADLNLRRKLGEDHPSYYEELTPLMVAAAAPGSSAEIVCLLLEAGADPRLTSQAGVTALWYAAGAPWRFFNEEDAIGAEAPSPEDLLARLRLLLDAGLPPNESANNGRTAVGEACDEADPARLALLIDRGASVWPVPVEGDLYAGLPEDLVETMREIDAERSLGPDDAATHGIQVYAIPLFQACESGSADCVRRILTAGFPVEFRCDGETAMHHARSREVAEALWEAGARPDVRGEMFDPLDIAFEDERYDVARFMLERLPVRDRAKIVQAQLLVSSGVHMNPEAIRILLTHGADPSLPDSTFGSALHYACWQGDGNMGRADETVEETVRLLIASGADPNAWDEGRGTPLHEAVEGDWGSPTSVRVLLELGARPDVHGPDSLTPVMIAARRGEVECVRLLLAAGANRHAKSEGGATAIDYARSHLRSWRNITARNDPEDEEDRQRNEEALREAEENLRLLEGERGTP